MESHLFLRELAIILGEQRELGGNNGIMNLPVLAKAGCNARGNDESCASNLSENLAQVFSCYMRARIWLSSGFSMERFGSCVSLRGQVGICELVALDTSCPNKETNPCVRFGDVCLKDRCLIHSKCE